MKNFFENDEELSENENVSNHNQSYSDQGIDIQNASSDSDIYVRDSNMGNTVTNTSESAGVSDQTPVMVPPTPPKQDRPTRERRLPAKFKDFVMK